MASRDQLHDELLLFSPNVYFQPPSNIQMVYPCIVYRKSSNQISHANDKIYKIAQEYIVTVMDRNPDNDAVARMLNHFPYCTPGSNFIVENINHFTLNLYY